MEPAVQAQATTAGGRERTNTPRQACHRAKEAVTRTRACWRSQQAAARGVVAEEAEFGLLRAWSADKEEVAVESDRPSL